MNSLTTWNEIEQQESARHLKLARVARKEIAAETGISEDAIMDVVTDADIVEALQLDNLDHFYVYGFMPDSPEERPEHPLEYPDRVTIVSDIRAQIAVFDYARVISDMCENKTKAWKDLTDEERREWSEAYMDLARSIPGYDATADAESDYPWCAPWYLCWNDPAITPEEAFEQDKEELTKLCNEALI